MIPWLVTVEVVVAIAAGLFCVVLGLAGRKPADLSLGASLLLELFLLAQIVVSVISPAFGNLPSGSGLEFWFYLVTAALLPPLGILWGLLERESRWSTVVIGVACLAVAVMLYRMYQIWFVQVA